MALIIETTGLQPVVVIKSLGDLELNHPATFDLYLEVKRDNEIFGNRELQQLQSDGAINILNSNGDDLNISQPIGSTIGSMESYAELTLNGDYTLGIGSEKNLFINPNGSDRDIILPDHSLMIGKTFNIYNVGVASDRLFLKEGGFTIAIVRKNKAVEVKASSVDFIVYEFGTSIVTQ